MYNPSRDGLLRDPNGHRKPARQQVPVMPTDNAQLTCASLLKVLADETRLSVVRQLIDGPKHVGQINEPLQLEQSLLSHHLKILRDAGLVRAERDGKAVLYSLLPEYQAAAKRDAIDLGCCLISFHS